MAIKSLLTRRTALYANTSPNKDMPCVGVAYNGPNSPTFINNLTADSTSQFYPTQGYNCFDDIQTIDPIRRPTHLNIGSTLDYK